MAGASLLGEGQSPSAKEDGEGGDVGEKVPAVFFAFDFWKEAERGA